MTDDTKFDPYASDVQEVKHTPQETPAAKAKSLNRKLALAGVGGVLMVIVLAVIAQSYGADQSQSELLEARRLQAQREPVNLDAEGAAKDAASQLALRETQIEKERKQAEANAATQEPVARVVAPSDAQGKETLALARGIASARDQPTGEAASSAGAKKPEEVDPWVEAARGFRAQDAQGYYQDRMAARRASQFFGGGTPTASSGGGGAQGTQGPGAPLPSGSDSPEAFVARLQAAQRPAQGGPQAFSSTSLLQPASSSASSSASSQPTAYAALDTGNAHQEAFYHQGGQSQAGYRGDRSGSPQGVADVQAGTVVHLVLETGLSSELPGVVIARVARPVYDPSLSRVTIPSGTKVIGTYNARVEKGQTRAQVLWTTLVWSGGGSFDLGGLPGVDLGGQSGVEAEVDNHWDRAFAGAALSGVLSASASALAGPTNQLAIDPRQQAIYGAARPFQEMGEASAKGYLELEPTLTLEPGALAGMLVPHDLSF